MKQAIAIIEKEIQKIINERDECVDNWKDNNSNLRYYTLQEQIKLLEIVKIKCQIKELEV